MTLFKWPCSLLEHNDLELMDSSRSELGVIFVRALPNCALDYQQTARAGCFSEGAEGQFTASWRGDWSRHRHHHDHHRRRRRRVLNGPGMLFRHFVH